MKRGSSLAEVLEVPIESSPNSRLRALESVFPEAFAIARQSLLFYRDVRAIRPGLAAPGDDVVVLVHGLFATAGVLRPMRERLERLAGAHTASFTYATGPGVERIAARLAELVSELPPGTRIHLVGHSTGGLAVRWFIQELGGDPRIVQTISLGTPFAGTPHARFLPARVRRDLIPGSWLQLRLAHSARRAERVPHLSIAATNDQVVPDGSLFATGEHMTIEACGHNSLLYHPRVTRELVRRIRVIRAAAEL